MKTAKEIKEIENNIKMYQQEELFKTGDFSFLTAFYLGNAKKSLSTAEILLRISEDSQLKKACKLADDFETYLWAITASYYSMFYAVNALFSKNRIKIGDKIAHKVASDVFYVYFIQNNKIAKKLFEIYEEAKDQALDLTATKYPEHAEKLSENLECQEPPVIDWWHDNTQYNRRVVLDTQNYTNQTVVLEHTEFHSTANPRLVEFCCLKEGKGTGFSTI